MTSTSTETKNSNPGGWNLFTVLFLIFLTLKLGNFGMVQDWSWWQVTSPLWGPVVVVGIALLLLLIVNFINDLLNNNNEKN